MTQAEQYTEDHDETLSPEALAGATVRDLALLSPEENMEAQARAKEKACMIKAELDARPDADPEWRLRASKARTHALSLVGRLQSALKFARARASAPSPSRVRRLEAEVKYLRGVMVKLRAVQTASPGNVGRLERELEASLDMIFGGA